MFCKDGFSWRYSWDFSEWSSHAGVSNDTVFKYTNLLRDTHILRLVKPFVGGKRAEIISTPKVYFIDRDRFHEWAVILLFIPLAGSGGIVLRKRSLLKA